MIERTLHQQNFWSYTKDWSLKIYSNWAQLYFSFSQKCLTTLHCAFRVLEEKKCQIGVLCGDSYCDLMLLWCHCMVFDTAAILIALFMAPYSLYRFTEKQKSSQLFPRCSILHLSLSSWNLYSRGPSIKCMCPVWLEADYGTFQVVSDQIWGFVLKGKMESIYSFLFFHKFCSWSTKF